MVTRLSGCDELRVIEQSSALIGREPVAKTNAEALNILHAADACGQLRAQEPSVGRLVRHAPNGGQAKVDRGGCVLPLLEVNPIPEDHGAIEGETWLRAVPGDELPNRVVAGALTAPGGQAADDRRLRLLQVW
jgi:hypothetical protein